MNNKRRRLGIPNRWINCPRIGEKINDLFVPFKTILDDSYNCLISPSERFDIDMFLNSSKTKNIGLVIDLTKTTRFYKSEKLGKPYVKIECEGHEGPPTDDKVKAFEEVVSNFMDKSPDELIGVHCTHGFNRTGYMIVCCLVDLFDMELDVALQLFSEARKPGIYKQDYLDGLQVKYDHPDDFEAPQRPPWCFEDGEDDDEDDEVKFQANDPKDGNCLSDSDSDSSHSSDASITNTAKVTTQTKRKHKKPKTWKPPKEAQFMEGVSGVTVVNDCAEIEQIHEQMRTLMKTERFGFLGSQPVSMTMENIIILTKKHYRVSWKADGTRYMMLIIDRDLVYMLDRDNCVYKINHIYFPIENGDHLTNTILDGEMVIDVFENKQFPRFLVYDIVVLNNEYVGNLDFFSRLNCIHRSIIKKRQTLLEPSLKAKESFSIRLKDFFTVDKTKNIWEGKFRKELLHEMDGLIFQPADKDDVYVIGRCDTILKWKPPHLNSIDFLLKCEYFKEKDSIPRYVGHLFVTGVPTPVCRMEKIKKPLREKYDGKIVECTLENNKWVIMRERTDKSLPNHISTAKSVLSSIKNPVDISGVYYYIDVYKDRLRHPQ